MQFKNTTNTSCNLNLPKRKIGLFNWVNSSYKWYKILGIALLIGCISSCIFHADRIFKSEQFSWYLDEIEQGDTVATAINSHEIHSNYFGYQQQWQSADTLNTPSFTSKSNLLNAIYQMALEAAQAKHQTIALSDLCYSSVLALATISPETCKQQLLQKVKRFNIIQNTNTNNGWPIYSQRVLWGLAAWQVYCATGDRVWLRKVFTITKRAIDADLNVIWNYEKQLFKGSVSANEAIFPTDFTPLDIFNSYSLRTQVVYYRNLKLLIDMGLLLQIDMQCYQHLLKALKKSITANYWMPKQQVFASYIYGDSKILKSNQQDVLAEMLGVVWNVFDKEIQTILMQKMPLFDFGMPTFLPCQTDKDIAIKALTQAFCTKAFAKNDCSTSVNWSMGCMMRAAALPLKCSNSWNATTGKPIAENSNCVAASAMLYLYHHVLTGIEFQPNKIAFSPFVPKQIGESDTLKIAGIKYRNRLLNIDIIGYGNQIKQCVINDKEVKKNEIMATAQGNQHIVIYMNNSLPKQEEPIWGKRIASLKTPRLLQKGDTVYWNNQANIKQYHLYKNSQLWQTTADTFFVDTIEKPCWFAVQAEANNQSKSMCSRALLLKPKSYERIVDAGTFQAFNTKPYVMLKADSVFTFKVRVPRDGRYRIAFIYNANARKQGCFTRSFWNNGNYLGTHLFPVYALGKPTLKCSNGIEIDVYRGYNIFKLTNEKFNRQNNGYPDQFRIEQVKLMRVK